MFLFLKKLQFFCSRNLCFKFNFILNLILKYDKITPVIILEEIFVTITGTFYKYGTSPIKVGQVAKLLKDTDNMFDNRAISVSLPGLGIVGYVANSPHTIAEGTKSADEIYNLFDSETYCRIMFIKENTIIGKIL